MRNKYRRTHRPKRKRTSLKASNAGPILALTATVVGVLGLIALIIFVGLPWFLPLVGVNDPLPWQPTPTPAPTIHPTPTPHPASVADPLELQKEVVLDAGDRYVWFAEPYASGDTLVFAAGRTDNGDVVMDALYALDMATGEQEKLSLPLENDAYVYPIVNDRWLVYLDGKSTGGGVIRATERETGKNRTIKTVYVGQPKLMLEGDYLVWMERTGSSTDKLFVCDLNTQESVTVQTFTNSQYGMSMPSIAGDEIIYAGDDPNATQANGANSSAIYSVSLTSGKTSVYTPNLYVHDPMTNGRQWVWRDGLHGEGDDLYLAQNGMQPKCIAEDIVEYGLSDTFVAYSKNEAIFVYFFDNGTTTQITPATGELALLMGVSDDTVIWMDVTSREQNRDIMKYARIR